MIATIVFQQIWDAIHAKKEDGSRKYKYIINTGSSRSSKTYSILQSHYLYALQNKNTRISIWRETKQDTKNTVLADFKKAIVSFENNQGIIFNKTESIYTFDNLSTIEMCGGDDENKVHGFQGDVAHFNEPYKISLETFNQIDMRTSGYILIDWNPKKGHWIDNLSKLDNAIVIHSTFKDNPFCPVEQKNKILSYQPISRCNLVDSGILTEIQAREYDCELNPLDFTKKQVNELVRCKLNEDKNSASDFNWSVYGLGEKAEKPNRIFSWKEIPFSEYQKLEGLRVYGVDWGTVDPWGILEAKYYDGNLYLHELNYKSENELLQHMSSTDRVQIAGDEVGIVTWMFQKLGIEKGVPVVCDTNRPIKTASLTRSGYQALTAPSKAILDGIDLLENLNVYYTSNSANLAFEQENYSRKVDRYGIVLEEPEDKDNHLIDPARYIALYLKIRGYIKKV